MELSGGGSAATPRTGAWEAAAARQAAGNLDAAENLYRELLEKEPENSELCFYHLGVLAEARGDVAAADQLYGEAETKRLNRLKGDQVIATHLHQDIAAAA